MERIYLMSFYDKNNGVGEITEGTFQELFNYIKKKDWCFKMFIDFWIDKNIKNYTENFEMNDKETILMLKEYFSIRNVEFEILN